MVTVTLSDGRTLELREPHAADMRGISLTRMAELDVGDWAPLVERISDLSAGEFFALRIRDALAVIRELQVFFQDAADSLSESKTPGP